MRSWTEGLCTLTPGDGLGQRRVANRRSAAASTEASMAKARRSPSPASESSGGLDGEPMSDVGEEDAEEETKAADEPVDPGPAEARGAGGASWARGPPLSLHEAFGLS